MDLIVFAKAHLDFDVNLFHTIQLYQLDKNELEFLHSFPLIGLQMGSMLVTVPATLYIDCSMHFVFYGVRLAIYLCQYLIILYPVQLDSMCYWRNKNILGLPGMPLDS